MVRQKDAKRCLVEKYAALTQR
nr:hypothetical protein [Tanacetum cinerariifolium]